MSGEIWTGGAARVAALSAHTPLTDGLHAVDHYSSRMQVKMGCSRLFFGRFPVTSFPSLELIRALNSMKDVCLLAVVFLRNVACGSAPECC